MDNLTHSLVGWALGEAGLKGKSRKGLAALVLGANMPDLDVFFGHSCWVPLATHRGFTHSLVGGMVVMPPLLFALLWLLDRWQVRRGATFRSGLELRPGWLLALCFIGALTHPLLDWQTSYAIQLLSPFSDHWFHAESLFIIDVWLWCVLGTGIFLSRRRAGRGENRQAPARAALVLGLAYILGNQLLTYSAKEALRTNPPYPRPEILFAQFEPVRFWERGLVWREEGRIGFARWSPFFPLEQVAAPVADNMSDPAVRRALVATPQIRRFMRWSVMPMAQVTRAGCMARVELTDARFAKIRVPWRGDGNPFRHVVRVPMSGAACP
ncbi:MAG: metal-dependent hydrolase [Novosphingobium sp.]|nr:metal-dependent hydrolase [Novosphingobium sp.]